MKECVVRLSGQINMGLISREQYTITFKDKGRS